MELDSAVMKKSEKLNNQKFIGEMLTNNRISGLSTLGASVKAWLLFFHSKKRTVDYLLLSICFTKDYCHFADMSNWKTFQ